MPILSFRIDSIGETGVTPKIIYIYTDDTTVEVTQTGYLNKIVSPGVSLSEADIALVTTKASPSATSIDTAFYNVTKSSSGWSLTGSSSPGAISISAGVGITCTPDPILGTGTVALEDSGVAAGQYFYADGFVDVNVKGQVTAIQAATTIIEAIADAGITAGQQTAGVVSLISGSAFVVTSQIKSGSSVFLSYRDTGVPLVDFGTLSYGSIIADTQFVITSSNALDVNDVSYLIVNPV